MIAIRLSYGDKVGFGHLKRMSVLANEFKKRGAFVVFITHSYEVNSENHINYISDFVEEQIREEIHDEVNATLKILNKYPSIRCVIVDDYSLDKSWENKIQREGYKVVAFDDILREHCADLVVDGKWRGENEKCAYRNLIPSDRRVLMVVGRDFVQWMNSQFKNGLGKKTNYINLSLS